MSIIINISELKETLEFTPSTQNIMLVGKHGIGKSEILTSYFNSKGMKVVTLFLGQMADPGDIIGIPSKVEKQDADGKATSRTDFTPPYWFPQDDQPIVLFLDELNRARPEILQTVMDLTLNRKLAGTMSSNLPSRNGSTGLSVRDSTSVSSTSFRTTRHGLTAIAVITRDLKKAQIVEPGSMCPTSCSR